MRKFRSYLQSTPCAPAAPQFEGHRVGRAGRAGRTSAPDAKESEHGRTGNRDPVRPHPLASARGKPSEAGVRQVGLHPTGTAQLASDPCHCDIGPACTGTFTDACEAIATDPRPATLPIHRLLRQEDEPPGSLGANCAVRRVHAQHIGAAAVSCLWPPVQNLRSGGLESVRRANGRRRGPGCRTARTARDPLAGVRRRAARAPAASPRHRRRDLSSRA